MKIAGFTIIRNAIKYDYPVVEAINSILILCDEFYIGVGKSDDDTRKLISSINSDKIKIIDLKHYLLDNLGNAKFAHFEAASSPNNSCGS